MIREAEELLNEVDEGPLRDAALVAAAQKVEHYEIASYGTLCEIARSLGHEEAAKILEETLNEEKETDQKLTRLAESDINEKAMRQAA